MYSISLMTDNGCIAELLIYMDMQQSFVIMNPNKQY